MYFGFRTGLARGGGGGSGKGSGGCYRDEDVCLSAYDENYPSMFTFRYGRTDCSDPDAEDNTLPASTLDHTATFAFFKEEFSDVGWINEDVRLTSFVCFLIVLTFQPLNLQTVAIMGAHTLGTLKKKNSGHDGPWIEGKCGSTTFDHQYYVNMFEPTAPELEWSVRVRWKISGHTFCPMDKLFVHSWFQVVQSPMEEKRNVDTVVMVVMAVTVVTAVTAVTVVTVVTEVMVDMVGMADMADMEAAPKPKGFSSPNSSVATLRPLERLAIAE